MSARSGTLQIARSCTACAFWPISPFSWALRAVKGDPLEAEEGGGKGPGGGGKEYVQNIPPFPTIFPNSPPELLILNPVELFSILVVDKWGLYIVCWEELGMVRFLFYPFGNWINKQ